jgi:hypothetical protein
MPVITYDEALSRQWLEDRDTQEKAEAKERQETSKNADYDFY